MLKLNPPKRDYRVGFDVVNRTVWFPRSGVFIVPTYDVTPASWNRLLNVMSRLFRDHEQAYHIEAGYLPGCFYLSID